MLRIITGTDRSGKTQLLASMVKQSIEASRNTYIIIPDQFSLVYDRKLYDILGAKNFNKITVIGPDRLAEKLLDRYGSSGKYCDDNARLIMMYKACKEFEASGAARYYRRSLGKGSFFSGVCETIDELRQSTVSADTLTAAAESLSGTVSDKLYDISQLYSLYLHQLDSYGLKDINSAISEAVEIIREHRIFDGCDIYFDSFSSFTGDQRSLLKAIFSQAHDVTAALTIGDGRNAGSNLSPFAVCDRTKDDLQEIADQTGHETKSFKADSYEYTNESLRALSDNVFAPTDKPVGGGDGIKLVTASDPYSEAEFVFAQIRRLVDEGKCRYGEIAVISRSLESCASVLEDMAYRYDVPLFCDLRKNVSQSSPVLFVNAVFENLVSKSFRTRSILSYIKSPLSHIGIGEAALIEEYCFKWSVDGDMWLSDFTASDKGSKEDKERELLRINDIRRRIVDPLTDLKNKCQSTDAADLSQALGDFMRSVSMNDRTFAELKAMSSVQSETSLEISRVFRQLWQLFLSAIESIHDILSDEKITVREYYELLRTMLSQMTVSSPPQKLDAVIAASSQHSRLSDIKAAFVIGVNDGYFPKNIHMQGLFSDREKEMLKRADIQMEKRLDTNIKAERFSCFQALCCASDLLYICIPSADRKGDPLNPSPLALQIKSMFSSDISVDASKLPLPFYCTSKKAALHKYSELIRSCPEQALTIKEALKQFPEYYERTEHIDRLLQGKQHSLSADTAKSLFFRNGEQPYNIRLSATKTDTFFRCPYRYFCRYGLGINESYKIELEGANIGSITHKCLEMTMQQPDGSYREDFAYMTDEEIEKKVCECVDEYIEETMGGDFGKNASFRAMVEELKKRAAKTVAHVRDELQNTDFAPIAFEFSLSDENGVSIMPIELPEEIRIDLVGFIDRVDLLTLGDECYVRIIDYKTGSTKFQYEQIYHGLNLQMLLYMLAVTSTVNKINPDRKLKPAGVIYMHAGEADKFADKGELLKGQRDGTTDTLKKRCADSAFSRDGIVADNIEVVRLMSKNGIAKFTPVSVNKPDKENPDGRYNSYQEKYVLSERSFEQIESYAHSSIVSMARSLSQGYIPSIPRVSSKFSPCDYCDYFGICANSGEEIRIKKEDGIALMDQIGADTSKIKAGDDEDED